MGEARRPGRLRAIVTDVDGTLTDQNRRLDSEAVELLRNAEARGLPVLIATGNVLPIALAVHRSIGLSGPIVAENGGILYAKEHGKERIVRLTDRRPAWRAYRRLRAQGVPVKLLTTDRWRETEVGLEANVPEATLRAALRGTGVSVEATGYAFHLMERGWGKLPALRVALRRIGLTPADCLIAGDGDNDVAMLRAAGWGVSFRSASPRARAAADTVAESLFARGFVEALKQSGVVGRQRPGSGR